MVASERQVSDVDDSRRKIIIVVVAIISAVVIATLIGFLLYAVGSGVSSPTTLNGAIRPGSSEFEQYHSKIFLDKPEAEWGKRALGDTWMTLHTTVRNFTGQTLSGIEVKAAVVDHQGKAVKERTVVVVPTKQAELEPNKTMFVQVMLDGMADGDDRADIKMEVTGFRFK